MGRVQWLGQPQRRGDSEGSVFWRNQRIVIVHRYGDRREFWLNLQCLYEIRLAVRKSGKSIKALPTLERLERAHA